MNESQIRFTSFPRTSPPPEFVRQIVEVFRANEYRIGGDSVERHLRSDVVLATLSPDLQRLGFKVELGKSSKQIIDRPVFFGENGVPSLRYEVDAYHETWKCGLEIEAIRGIRGGAFYRDLIQAMVMVGVDHLCIAVLNKVTWGKTGTGKDYAAAIRTAEALYGHSRIVMPYGLTVIGY